MPFYPAAESKDERPAIREDFREGLSIPDILGTGRDFHNSGAFPGRKIGGCGNGRRVRVRNIHRHPGRGITLEALQRPRGGRGRNGHMPPAPALRRRYAEQRRVDAPGRFSLLGHGDAPVQFPGSRLQRGSHEGGDPDAKDLLSVVGYLVDRGTTTLHLAGYSYGAWIALKAIREGFRPPIGDPRLSSAGFPGLFGTRTARRAEPDRSGGPGYLLCGGISEELARFGPGFARTRGGDRPRVRPFLPGSGETPSG